MKKRYEKFIEDYDFFTDRIYEIIDLKEKLTDKKRSNFNIEKIDFDDNKIYVDLEESTQYCGYDRDTYRETLTVDELFMDLDEYKEKVNKEIADRKKKEETKKKADAMRKKNQKEKEDRKEFKRLSKKFKK